MKPFRFWVQTALPLVYEDSLSYYELLSKVVDYINNMLAELQGFGVTVDEYTAKVDEIQKYVDGYFSSADFRELVDEALDQMAEDGDFDAIIEPIINELAQDVNDALVEVEGITGTFNGRVSALETAVEGNTHDIEDLQTDVGNIDSGIAGLGDVWKVVFVSGNSIGDCFYMCKGDKAVVFDCGQDASATALNASLAAHGVTKIVAIIISHWHSDHANGLSGLLANTALTFTGCVLYRPHSNLNYSRCTGDWVSYVPDRVSTYSSAVIGKGGSVVNPTEGQSVNIEGLTVVFSNLSDTKFEYYYSDTTNERLETTAETQYNDFCMLCAVYLGETKLAFSADLMPVAEAQNKEFPAGASLYKVEHHALNRKTDSQYANAISAQLSVVTDYGTNHSESMRTKTPTVNRCIGVGSLYDTINGEVEFTLGKFGITCDSEVKAVGSPLYQGVLAANTTLYDSVDFNTLVEPGVYGVGSYSDLSRMINRPPEADSGGKLLVDSLNNSGYINQIFVQSNSQTPAVHVRCRAWENNTWVWRRWRTLRPSLWVEESTAEYVLPASITLLGSNYQNRYRIQNGVISMSFYFNTSASISANTALFDIPYDLFTEYTPFLLYDTINDDVYPCIGGTYNGNYEVWCTKEIPSGVTLVGSFTTAIRTNYPT